MARNQYQQQESNSARENAAKLAQARAKTMSDAAASNALRNSESVSQVSPSPTPSKDSTAFTKPTPTLNESVAERLNAPPDTSSSQAPRSGMQDIQNIGQSLKSQSVTSSETLPPDSKARIENSFDKNNGTGSTPTQEKPLSETARVTAQAKQSAQTEKPLPSQEYER